MIVDLGVIAICYFAALSWGSNEPWAMSVIAVGTFSLLALRLIQDAWQGSLEPRRSRVYLPLLFFVVYTGLQVAGQRAGLESARAWLPHTVDGHSSTLYFLLAASYVALVFLVHNGFRSRFRVKMLLIAIVALGLLEALYGLLQYLGNYGYIWDYQVTTEVARGTFINRNHYALLLNLSICAGLGYLYYCSIRFSSRPRTTLLDRLSALGLERLAWVALGLAFMGMALIFSRSRMGIAALAGCAGMMVITGKISRTGKRIVVFGLSVGLALASLALYTGIDVVLERYEKIAPGQAEEDRLPMWQDAWKMIRGHVVLGQGLGTFRWTYPEFESVDPDVPAMYAHNDYIQAVAEVGVIGLLMLLAAYALAWKTAARNLLTADDPLVKGIGLAVVGGLTATALQELTDFSLYIPGVAATFAVLVGLNFRASHLGVKETRGVPATRMSFTGNRPLIVLQDSGFRLLIRKEKP